MVYHLESVINNKVCCRLLIFWSVVTTMASMVSVYYAIDVHTSHNVYKEISALNALLGDVVNQHGGARSLRHSFLLSNKTTEKRGKAPLRVTHRLGKLYSFTRFDKRAKYRNQTRASNSQDRGSNTSGIRKQIFDQKKYQRKSFENPTEYVRNIVQIETKKYQENYSNFKTNQNSPGQGKLSAAREYRNKPKNEIVSNDKGYKRDTQFNTKPDHPIDKDNVNINMNKAGSERERNLQEFGKDKTKMTFDGIKNSNNIDIVKGEKSEKGKRFNAPKFKEQDGNTQTNVNEDKVNKLSQEGTVVKKVDENVTDILKFEREKKNFRPKYKDQRSQDETSITKTSKIPLEGLAENVKDNNDVLKSDTIKRFRPKYKEQESQQYQDNIDVGEPTEFPTETQFEDNKHNKVFAPSNPSSKEQSNKGQISDEIGKIPLEVLRENDNQIVFLKSAKDGEDMDDKANNNHLESNSEKILMVIPEVFNSDVILIEDESSDQKHQGKSLTEEEKKITKESEELNNETHNENNIKTKDIKEEEEVFNTLGTGSNIQT